ncbi:MAG TPA: class I SAM-dependent methyltransferase [Terriglobales bacterium]|jgi:SAM-dependent methyltransferase|nr:class I SAM-dependent methyltransferase [Terriglobales bacterium]
MASHAEQLEYMLGRSHDEHDRLKRQGRLISKITRHFLEAMGLHSGMRVLDVGCGVGDVALLAASMVAPDGQVVGIDLDEAALRMARHRAAVEELHNVQFRAADFQKYMSDGMFDAVIGRCVLLHQQNPGTALSSVAQYVRSGGIIGFQEPWFSRGFSFPRVPLFEEVIRWLHSTVEASGLDGNVGLRLPFIFASIGLPAPKLTFEMLVDCSPDSEVCEFVAHTVRSLLPRLEQLGIVSSARVQVDTLAGRLRQEQAELGGVVGVMPLLGAWCRKP